MNLTCEPTRQVLTCEPTRQGDLASEMPGSCKKNTQLPSRAIVLNEMFQTFARQCELVLESLRCAKRGEIDDMSTSNGTVLGWFISNESQRKNFRAADLVDDLSQRADWINREVLKMGFMALPPLNSHFNGDAIREAEKAEHSFVMNWLTDYQFSEIQSRETVAQIQETIRKVSCVHAQALSFLSKLPYFTI